MTTVKCKMLSFTQHLFTLTAGGRREPVTIGKVLKFVTGREFEPVLGFSMNPTIQFDDSISLPHANTCIYQLRLPLSPNDYNVDLFDLAFMNDYFGMI